MYDKSIETKALKRFILIVVIALIALGAFLYRRPLQAISPIQSRIDPIQTSSAQLSWPSQGQAAIGANGYGVLATSGKQEAVPIASITKLVTAIAVLDKYPIPPSQQGPTINLTDRDVAIYDDYVSKGGSVVKVVAGEQISEYQAIQAMLLPSANNIADSVATWAFGSMDAYVKYVSQFIQRTGLKGTMIADASGFSPNSVSTASDLILLGQVAMENETIAQIVGQKDASLPVVGMVSNVNWLLGTDGIIGIKTGNTDAAGGCYLFASKQTVSGQNITIIGSVLGALDLNQAITSSQILLHSTVSNFEIVKILPKGTVVGHYSTPQGANIKVITKEDITALMWKGQTAKVNVSLNKIKYGFSQDQPVGVVTLKIGNKNLETSAFLNQPVPPPSFFWRIFR